MVCRNVGKDGRQRSNAKMIVVWNGDVVLCRLFARQAYVTARLAANPVAEDRECLDELSPGNVPGKLHAAMTSSRT